MPIRTKVFYMTIGFCVFFIFVAGFIYPRISIQAALIGISIWWDVLFPALFPFFVISEIMLGIGVVHFVGTLLDPFMRPLFRVSGKGGFVMAMGFASGYPVAARLTSQLWTQRLIHRDEGERLVSFTTTADPIFLIGAVSVGFFHEPGLALLLATAHYGSAVIVGLIMRFHGTEPDPIEKHPGATKHGLLKQALKSMHEARIADGRSLGQLLEQAIRSSLQLVMVIGGLVVFFSVVMELMRSIGMLQVMIDWTAYLLALFQVNVELASALTSGWFEVTLGAQHAAQDAGAISDMHRAAVAAFILSWAGLSVHAQVVSLLNQTDLRYGPFIFARFIHGLISMVLVILLWKPLQPPMHSIALWMSHQRLMIESSYIPITILYSISLVLGCLFIVTCCAILIDRAIRLFR